MLFSIITPNFNGERYLADTLASIVSQRSDGLEVQLIVIDGESSDGSRAILEGYRDQIDILVIEKDRGPAEAINKGLALAQGDILAWLNADDLYLPGALARVSQAWQEAGDCPFVFGKCAIVNEEAVEIRGAISRFKEFFYPLSCRFVFQCINYISQPAMFFSKKAYQQIGPLRTDMTAAWDYEFLLRLWRLGQGRCISGPALAAFRWHQQSISGSNFHRQFEEELAVAAADAGPWAPQTLIHHGVRWGIVAAYSAMALARRRAAGKARR